MRDQHQGGAEIAVQAEQQIAHRFGRAVVQVAGGLVGQQQSRAVHQGTGNGHALLLAARELTGPVVHAIGQTDGVQHLGRGFAGVRLSGHLQRQGGVVQRAQAGQEVKTLEHDADAVAPQIGQAIGIQAAQVHAIHTDLPSRRPLKARQQEQQRGFARARRPSNRHAAALCDAQRNVAQDVHGALADAVVHGQAIGLDQVGIGGGHGRIEGVGGQQVPRLFNVGHSQYRPLT